MTEYSMSFIQNMSWRLKVKTRFLLAVNTKHLYNIYTMLAQCCVYWGPRCVTMGLFCGFSVHPGLFAEAISSYPSNTPGRYASASLLTQIDGEYIPPPSGEG